MTRYVVLVRAINVGARHAPMADLRAACEAVGFADVQSYIASGNLVLSAAQPAAEVEAKVEQIFAERYGFHADAIARTAAEWRSFLAAAAFAAEREARPTQIHLCLSKSPPLAAAAERLAERATLGERFIVQAEVLWADFAGGVGKSKITPSLLDRCVGSPVTSRNWNTVLKLAEMSSGTDRSAAG
ncbi:DUF1697 domain-containing protein [Phenylobacterium immobile]|uniref:DUF1697 domain-containing protein n=1 Tax=Phenylobacterium immobile TaxID=21 RepID=UPI000B2F21B0|nr:DUF1697 domain-containing protein [Phenylobacterium immobile]